jgi:hypothetical protein
MQLSLSAQQLVQLSTNLVMLQLAKCWGYFSAFRAWYDYPPTAEKWKY